MSFLKDLYRKLGRKWLWKITVPIGYFFLLVVWRGRDIEEKERKDGAGEG